ncbi:MAG: GIY-YIG nuclease family protein [Ignavibacteria bacterium]|nr:GIY-YIG nuclease family protein [Ignavibacteria bacterium]
MPRGRTNCATFAVMDNDRPLLSEALETKIAGLPTKPGVYLHKDAEGQIIYVGKAKSLRNRVRSYFQEGRPVDAKTKALVRKIADLEVIVRTPERSAHPREYAHLRYRPKYNILLKDDKSYPYIRITKEEYPRVFKTRRVVRDGSKYFGPYTDGTYLYSLLKTLRSIFPLRSCELALTDATIDAGRWKVCLDYHTSRNVKDPAKVTSTENNTAEHPSGTTGSERAHQGSGTSARRSHDAIGR